MTADIRAKSGLTYPSMPKLVKVAKIPAAGVKPPYRLDWTTAAMEPNVPKGKHKVLMTVCWRFEKVGVLLTSNDSCGAETQGQKEQGCKGESDSPGNNGIEYA